MNQPQQPEHNWWTLVAGGAVASSALVGDA